MAADLVVQCPECEKKFKPKTDVSGKKIKCPFCTAPFVVPMKNGKAAVKTAKSKPDAKPVPVVTAAPEPDADMEPDDNPNPYGVKTVEIVPRCPNCTQEMGAHDIICLNCGYNTVLRTWGKTTKVVGLTFERHLMYLLPAIGSVFFVVGAVTALIFNDVVVPYFVAGSWMEYLFATEATRMWGTILTLFLIWGAGLFCFKKFIEQPKPDEIELEENAEAKPKKKK